MICMVWGFTFYFVWFSVISNPDEVKEMRKSIVFNIVSGTVYTMPVFFFCSGFLQTYSFLQRDSQASMFTKQELGKWYLRKITRYIPLNGVAMLFTLFLVPFLGFGPIWDKFKMATAGCSSNWWTNLLWINNLYPRAFDEKCLPWTWFVPCWVQLTLLLPPIVACYRLIENRAINIAIYVVIIAAILGFQFLFTFSKNLGGSMVGNDEFFSQVYMNPLSHMFSFVWGIYMGISYYKYTNERGYANEVKNSLTTRTLEMISHNTAPRYLVYLFGLSLLVLGIIWQTPFVGSPQDQSRAENTLYATFNSVVFLLGLAMLVMPALAGKCAVFRFLFCSPTWMALSNLSIGMYYTVPMVALFYNFSTQHSINVNYYMFLYYFTGNLVFGIVLFIPLCLFVDKPIQSWLNLKEDVEDALHSKYYQIDEYLQIFMNGELSEGDLAGEVSKSSGLDPDIQLRLVDGSGAPLVVRDRSIPISTGKKSLDDRRSDLTSERVTAFTSRPTSSPTSKRGTTQKRGSNDGRGRFTRHNDLDLIEEEGDV